MNTKTIIYAGKEYKISFNHDKQPADKHDLGTVTIGYFPAENNFALYATRPNGWSVMFGCSNTFPFEVVTNTQDIRKPSNSFEDIQALEYSRGLHLDDYRIWAKMLAEKILDTKLSKVKYFVGT